MLLPCAIRSLAESCPSSRSLPKSRAPTHRARVNKKLEAVLEEVLALVSDTEKALLLDPYVGPPHESWALRHARTGAFEPALRELVFSVCVEDFQGSFSAEHAVGRKKQNVYDRYTPAEIRGLSALLKANTSPGQLGSVTL